MILWKTTDAKMLSKLSRWKNVFAVYALGILFKIFTKSNIYWSKKKNMYYNFLQNKKFVLVKIWNWKSFPINFLQYGFLCNYEYFSGKAWLPVSLGYKYEVTYRSNSSFCVEELHKLGNGKKKIAKLLKMSICTIRAIINWRC